MEMGLGEDRPATLSVDAEHGDQPSGEACTDPADGDTDKWQL
jgi:hypothetical protein